jgi:XTP/dITP diphosphohydrolase
MTEEPPTELLIATSNKGKIAELRSLLEPLTLRLRGLEEFAEIAEVAETGSSFPENAILKARGYAAQTQLWTLADDSGLEVDALGGAPGVYSARYGGEGLSDADRTRRLLENLSQVGGANRDARFVCAIAIADPRGEVSNVSCGICEGRIAFAPRGTNGFGYDPVFVPEGYELSFGELATEIKEKISHRARALSAARSFLLGRFPSI